MLRVSRLSYFSFSPNTHLSHLTLPPLDLNQYIPGCVLDPVQLHHELEAPEIRYRLARAVLQEIPRQVVEYMKRNGISPRVADIPDDL